MKNMTIGYSGTPLVRKLGIKENFSILLINEPSNYFELFEGHFPAIAFPENQTTKVDFIHYFPFNAQAYSSEIKNLKSRINPAGMIWVSWFKKSSGIATDITEDIIRKVALQNELVDVKVCAIDERYSGLKLVIPVNFRQRASIG